MNLQLEIDDYDEDYIEHEQEVRICTIGLIEQFEFGSIDGPPRFVVVTITELDHQGAQAFKFGPAENEDGEFWVEFEGKRNFRQAIYHSFGRWLRRNFLTTQRLWMSVEIP